MSAFDRAWALLKAPLDLDSIEIPNVEGWEDFEARAEFIHPTNPAKRYPMKVRGDGTSTDVWIEDGGADLDGVRRNKIAFASVEPVELEFEDPMEWLKQYGGVPANQWVIDELIEEDKNNPGKHTYGDYFDSMEKLVERMENQQIDEGVAERFMEKHTGNKLSVQQDYRRLGMGSALYDLLTELGFNVSPNVNQDLRGRLMWLKNQGITDHRFAPPYEYPDDLPKGKRGKRRGDLEYDFARLSNEIPPYWRGLRERRRLGI